MSSCYQGESAYSDMKVIKPRVQRHEEEIILLADVLNQFMMHFEPILCYSTVPDAQKKLRAYRDKLAEILNND